MRVHGSQTILLVCFTLFFVVILFPISRVKSISGSSTAIIIAGTPVSVLISSSDPRERNADKIELCERRFSVNGFVMNSGERDSSCFSNTRFSARSVMIGSMEVDS